MAVKVLIERTVRSGYERQVLSLLRELRVACLARPGYISGETLRLATNPSVILVISTWSGQGDWRAWENSPARTDIGGKIRSYLVGPPVVEIFLEGLSDSHSGA